MQPEHVGLLSSCEVAIVELRAMRTVRKQAAARNCLPASSSNYQIKP
jgi:hypothetical protein